MGVTELRVHGVGGSTPEEVLNTGPAHQVAGDRDAGFYVAADPQVEAYCWGNLTAGAASRALWLLMLPFTLVNASFWMGPRRRANEALVRLLALSLTATAVLAAEGVGTDLLGWQCAGRASCRDRHSWLRWLGSGTMATPGRRAAVGAVVPLLVLLLLGFLARRTARYEKVRPPRAGGPAPLQDPTFWYGARQVARLRQLHLTVGLAVVGLGMAWPLWDWDRHHGGALRVVDAGLVVALSALIAVACVAVCLPTVVRREGPEESGPRWPRQLPRLALVVVLATVVAAVVPGRAGWAVHAARALPGYGAAVTAVFLAQLAGIALLAAVVLPHRDRGAAARGLAQPVFGALGLLLASVFTAGLAFRVADWLDGGKNPTEGPLRLPLAYQWAALALLVVAVPGALLIGVRALHRYRVERRAALPRVRAAYGEPPAALEGRLQLVAKAQARASLTDAALSWLSWLTAASLVAALAAMGLTLATGESPAQQSGLLRLGTQAGTWLVSGIAALLVLVGYRSYRTASLRHRVGILWDVGTFWPRAAHPLAPPCYAERCVPDLSRRVDFLAAQGGVVLSAHSQGSVLAAALVWQLPDDVRERVRLLTYGSPLARLYGRLYGSWFGPAALEQLQGTIGADRWVNLWRRTDFIGAAVGTQADVELPRDPEHLEPPPGDPTYPVPHTHFDYELTPEYAKALAGQVESL
jgi:hypothetical protein